MAGLADHLRNFTVASLATQPGGRAQPAALDALKRVRSESSAPEARTPAAPPQVITPDKTAKFEAKTDIQGDISQVVGGASDKPIPSAPRKIEPKGAPGGTLGGLMEAKRRAQQKIKEKEQDNG